MKNLTCQTCGSNHFKENKNTYQCLYCETVITKVATTNSKRTILIIALLFVIVAGLFITNKLLFSVKDDIKILTKQQKKEPTSVVILNETKQYQEKNPFANLILKVEKKSGEELKQNSLEEALSKYYKKEKNKAFYIALTNKGQYAFGISYSSTSIQKAEKAAKRACTLAKKEKKIQDKCIPYAVNNHISKFLIENPRP